MTEKILYFYHRNSNRTSYARQGCVEQIYKDEKWRFYTGRADVEWNESNPHFPMKGTYPAYIAWRLQKKKMDPFVPFQFLKYSEADPILQRRKMWKFPI